MPPWQWLKVSKAGATSLLWLFQFEVIKIKWHLKCSSPVISNIPITQQQHGWNFPSSQKVLSDRTASETLQVFTTGAMLSFLHLIICHNVILLLQNKGRKSGHYLKCSVNLSFLRTIEVSLLSEPFLLAYEKIEFKFLLSHIISHIIHPESYRVTGDLLGEWGSGVLEKAELGPPAGGILVPSPFLTNTCLFLQFSSNKLSRREEGHVESSFFFSLSLCLKSMKRFYESVNFNTCLQNIMKLEPTFQKYHFLF